MLDGITDGHRDDLYKVIDQRYLGDDGFVERVEEREPEKWKWGHAYGFSISSSSSLNDFACGAVGRSLTCLTALPTAL